MEIRRAGSEDSKVMLPIGYVETNSFTIKIFEIFLLKDVKKCNIL